MIKRYTFSLILLFCVVQLMAQSQLRVGVSIENTSIKKYDREVLLKMSIRLDAVQTKSNEQILLNPMFVKGADTLFLLPVKVLGRRQAIYQVRNAKKGKGADEMSVIRKNGTQQVLAYQQRFSYQEWMEGARLVIYQDKCKCNYIVDAGLSEVGKANLVPPPFTPALAFIRPEVTVKIRKVEGSARLTFPQGKTNIDITLGSNISELEKIWQTSNDIQSIKKVKIDNITFHGYASPEGSYAANARLAQQRVMAVKEYALKRFNFIGPMITVEYTPEDWAYLRELVAASDLLHKQQILELIDSNYEPDKKEWKIKSVYPKDYAYMLKHYYPQLRRTDYTVSYTVGDYTVEEAREALKTSPELLNLNEFYLVAQTYPTDSEAFSRVFEIAARLFPDDALANVNAANAALSKGDLPMATGYLAKAGDSGEAANARGVKAMLEDDLDEALSLLQEAKRKGIVQAEENIEQIKYRIENY